MRVLALIAVLVASLAVPALAQVSPPFPLPSAPAATAPEASGPARFAPLPSNPLQIMAEAARAMPGGSPAGGDGEPRGLSTVMSVMLLLTVLSLAPSIILMTTCFVRIVVVLALLRQAIGTQNLPPPQVTIGLALFMTLLVMSPTIDRVYGEAVLPYNRGEITDYETLWNRGKQPLRDFMFDQIEATGNWSSLYMVLNYRGVDTSRPELLKRADVDMVALVPAFMLSELKTSFLMGFRVYLPFLVIDMVIATMLISMSMMMLPPVLVSLPFKLLLFVLVDGWSLVVGSLMSSFATPGSPGYAAAVQTIQWMGGGWGYA
ncbi:MAG: flagellar type III secretion system pore protein FliP [Phycisphaerales bacterium]